MRELSWKAAHKVAEIWGTGLLIKNSTMQAALTNILVPCDDNALLQKAVEKMLNEHNC